MVIVNTIIEITVITIMRHDARNGGVVGVYTTLYAFEAIRELIMSKMTVDDLSKSMQAERQRVIGPEDYSVWYDRGWFHTSKGNKYRRSEVEAFIEKWKSMPDWDGKPEPEEGAASIFAPKG
jgi:hypothetical protein